MSEFVPLKIKAVSLEDLKRQERDFKEMLDKWASKDKGRTYNMNAYENKLELEILSYVENESN
jgi:hypothetical protein